MSNPSSNVCLCECYVFSVEVFALVLSLVQGSPTYCGVSECDGEAPIIRRPWPTRGCCNIKKYIYGAYTIYYATLPAGSGTAPGNVIHYIPAAKRVNIHTKWDK
jgi:hypothetical protein